MRIQEVILGSECPESIARIENLIRRLNYLHVRVTREAPVGDSAGQPDLATVRDGQCGSEQCETA